ncbi:MAG: hypothetical protein DHS20C20_26400 [Ardenticatenaceae bacterium]|nr:MAG: hypothetical protein DHS20C20_26400 [Ardenticatenaceae bacterium]
MLTRIFIRLILRLVSRPWMPRISAFHSDSTESYSARPGPFHLHVMQLRSLDCLELYLGLRGLPWPKRSHNLWRFGRQDVGFRLCSGTDCLEQTGIHTYWYPVWDSPTFRLFVADGFAHFLFVYVPRWLHCRWARDHQEHQSAWEETVSARLGPLYLESNDVFVLDHSDVYLAICLPLPRRENGRFGLSAGRWQRNTFQLGYRACRGEEQVRQAGFEMMWKRQLPVGATMRNN